MSSAFDSKPGFFRPSVRRKEVDLRIVPLGFAIMIATGMCLLMLPWAHQPVATVHFL